MNEPKDPKDIVIAKATYNDGHQEDITGARFFELLEYIASMQPDGQMPAKDEKELLEMFAEHPNEVLPRDMLLSRLWGIDYYGNTRTLDQHIVRLRQKLGADGMHIVTISRVGYAYENERPTPQYA